MSQSKNQAQLIESLSALVDDEASEFEVHRVLTESQQDASVRERWHRYQLARAALRGEAVNLSTTSTAFADRIRDAIGEIEFDEPLATTASKTPAEKQQTSSNGRWKTGAGRFAIAASVAAAVFLGAQQMNLVAVNEGPGQAQEFAQQPAEPAPSAPSSVNIPTINVQNVSGGDTLPPRSGLPQSMQYSPNIQQQQLQDEQIRRYIRQLMLEHAEHSAQNSGSGLLPYARVPAEEER
ncbi:sigma-E factor negative regulatory protein [Proteobacteria bacterium 005FR1]|nr:sigma-E factor negative regulatory protein [Proteobacteria bacterium 005FR1]